MKNPNHLTGGLFISGQLGNLAVAGDLSPGNFFNDFDDPFRQRLQDSSFRYHRIIPVKLK